MSKIEPLNLSRYNKNNVTIEEYIILANLAIQDVEKKINQIIDYINSLEK